MTNTTNPPKKARLPKWLLYGNVQLPSWEAEEYIEHDFQFGKRDHQYATSCDRQLSVKGAILEFRTLRGRSIFAAIIPDEVEYRVDWGSGMTADPDYVLRWHAEWYETEEDAETALALCLERTEYTPNDEEGTYGIDGFGVAA